MPSTFHGLEVARRALFTQQSALHTTSHNIANANTEGYSRQRVNFEQTSPFPAPGRNRPEIPGQMGTGVEAGQIERIRDEFLDFQYRSENNKNGYWSERSDALSRMEDIMNEPSDQGLAKAMDQFWKATQDLATNPEDGGVRRVMRQRATSLAETFQYVDQSLKDVQGELKNQLEANGSEVNAVLSQIQELNDQIGRVEPNGYLPNDLYDKRDNLIDQLSEFVNIKVDYVGSGGNSKPSAMGKAVITLANDDRQAMQYDSDGDGTKDSDIQLITSNNKVQDFSVDFNKYNGQELVSMINVNGVDSSGNAFQVNIDPSDFNSSGQLRAVMHANGYVDVDDVNNPTTFSNEGGDYYQMISDLNKVAFEFTKKFNEVHRQGYDMNGNDGRNFFVTVGGATSIDETNAASMIDLHQDIKDSENNIAASADGNPGNGEHAIELAEVRDLKTVDLNGNSVQKYYEGMIGDLGVQAQESNRMANNSEQLLTSVDNNRQSVSGVSLDEEMANMIKFQHAYNAAARSMTTVDEMLDRVINQMGIVGR
ncbi:flagellar hook-associated protein FlgK [Filobacillus milosensis]|uniref:Flagellar hook-associated protein 1 n=1 Tax=Filobacillus milosensis TaxID=94137 RepID=A0A4Y8IU68_9BACI|nr:flagellar hook-associated protein FlgK [Filobacillus milosensis]TFB24380.1 flagellar hook-associated protein FlgK [Filobacillus milosensis]